MVRPEKNTNYEVGLKTQFFDRRLALNVGGYYSRVTDFQASVTDTGAAAALRTYLANIPTVVVKGFEAEATAALTGNLSLRASVAYGDGKYSSYPNGPCPVEKISSATTVCNLGGQSLSGLPKWSYTLGGDYSLPLSAKAKALFHLFQYTHQTIGRPNRICPYRDQGLYGGERQRRHTPQVRA